MAKLSTVRQHCGAGFLRTRQSFAWWLSSYRSGECPEAETVRPSSIKISDGSRCFLAVSISLFALSGKQILRVRNNVKNAKADNALHQEEPQPGPDGFPPPRERRFSSFARSFMAPSMGRGSKRSMSIPISNSEQQNEQQISPELAGLEPLAPLAPIVSHEVLDVETQPSYMQGSSLHQTSSPPVGTWTPGPPALDHSMSDQSMLHTTSEQQIPSLRR